MRDDALRLAWAGWVKRPDLPVTCHTWYSCKWVFLGRDWPGCYTPDTDALYGAQQGGDLEGSDPMPGPDVQALWAEQWERFWDKHDTDRDRKLIDAYLKGMKNNEIAELLEVTPARTTQLRKAMAEEFWKG